MSKTVYEDYKYCIQDLTSVCIGSKYTLGEILESEEIPFKFQMLAQKNILPEADPADTLETHLYYLAPDLFLVKIYRQLKARVKVSVRREKTGAASPDGANFTTKVMPVENLVKLSTEEKEEMGLVIQELIISKLALMGF